MSDDDSTHNNNDPEHGSKDNFEPPKTTKKLIRVLTVFAYLSSVSMAAIMLSLYYIFLWNPKVPTYELQIMPSDLPFILNCTSSTNPLCTTTIRPPTHHLDDFDATRLEEPRVLPNKENNNSSYDDQSDLRPEDDEEIRLFDKSAKFTPFMKKLRIT